MASVADCIEKLVAAGHIGRAVADDALSFYERSKVEHSLQMGPASADAAAALKAAKYMRDKAAEKQIGIAADITSLRDLERRVYDDQRGRNAGLMNALVKDTARGANVNADIPAEHPLRRGANVNELGKLISAQFSSMIGDALDKFKPGIMGPTAEQLTSSRNLIREIFGVDTGDKLSQAVAQAVAKVMPIAEARAKAAGISFKDVENYRVPQPKTSSQVARFTPEEFQKWGTDQLTKGGIKLMDKETGRFATADKWQGILEKAYYDIKTEGGDAGPFSKQGRTFIFQPGEKGAQAWLEAQAKFGRGNEIMQTVISHIDRMAQDIALHEVFGAHPDANFKAMMRLVKEQPAPGMLKGGVPLVGAQTLQMTYDNLAGHGAPVGNETFARIMSASRDIVGMASLRNLPITIIPGDSAMTLLSSKFLGMDGFKILGETFNGKVSKEVADHLQISAHGYMDFVNNSVRQYEDQINATGLARRVSRGIVRATGADLWTENIRRGWQTSVLNQIDGMKGTAFDNLDPSFRRNMLQAYGFTPEDWDKIRAAPSFEAANGAKYLDTTQIEPKLADRLLMAIREQSAYGAHQPDARTQALMTQGTARGTIPGELMRTVGQYKQFTMERMTTHLTRIMLDGPMENRVARGAAFVILGMAAGAVSLQASALLSGKDPIDMVSPKFWATAFVRGGAGAIYGDILSAAFQGNRGSAEMVGQMAGPIPGFAADLAKIATAPMQQAIDPSGRRGVEETFLHNAFMAGKRWTPETWYTKLAVDRMIFDKLQMLSDSNYRASFNRAEQFAKKQGQGYWFPQGESAPSRAPDLSTAIGR